MMNEKQTSFYEQELKLLLLSSWSIAWSENVIEKFDKILNYLWIPTKFITLCLIKERHPLYTDPTCTIIKEL